VRVSARTLSGLALAAIVATVSPTAVAGFDESAALQASQGALGREVRDVEFIGSRGERPRLAALRGQPVVISMIYTNCSSVCPATTRHLAQVVRSAREALGASRFTVLSVGFDPVHDTPQALGAFAREQRIDDPQWLFVSTTPQGVRRLADDTGFWFSGSGGFYEHLTQTTILDARGRIIRQLYGDGFAGPQFIEPLRRAALGAPIVDAPFASLVTRLRLLCTVYDARLGRYRFDYSLALSMLIALTTLLVVLGLVARAWRATSVRAPE